MPVITDSPQTVPRSRQDVAVGLIAIAVAFGWEATNYEMGRAIRMGPGFIPMALAVILGVLGIAVALAGTVKHSGTEAGPVSWRGIVLVCVALVIFGAYGKTLGLVPVVFICSLITALASTRNTLFGAIAISASLAALCWVVFKLGLGMSLPTIGPVFGPLQIH
jgi:hypothetical protein